MVNNPILISLFNHKGGVSKTTTTFNLGWTFSDMGIKTLIVDLDPQCNLTAYVLGLKEKETLDSFYKDVSSGNIFSTLEPIMTGSRLDIQPVKVCETLHDNLKLIVDLIKEDYSGNNILKMNTPSDERHL